MSESKSNQQVIDAYVAGTFVPGTYVPLPGEWLDPRSADLQEDSQLWYQLMALIKHDKELFAMLDSLRESGTTLQKQTTMYKLTPVIDPTGKYGYATEEDFKDMTKHLKQKKDVLTVALMQVHQRCGGR